ncbi:MAG: tyrosine-type recombinase/integrase [Bdellovibrionaceae bacterium]|nr:tyrosine-type recombinase/integrase [Pseudobdellovibrionaceae bacterium]
MKNITELVLNFIEKLDFKEKTSPHTVVAYAGDLHQAFASFLPGPVIGPAIDGSADYSFCIKDTLKKPAFCALTVIHLEDITRNYLKSLSALETSSRARTIATMRKFFTFLKQEHIVDEIPKILVTPKAAQKIPHFLSVDEALAVLKLFSTPELSPRELQSKVLFLLLYGTGLRVSEACSLRWQDVNISKRELRILGKGNKQRMISMPVLVQMNLASIRSSQNQTYIWGEQPLNTRTAYNYISQVGKKAGLSKPIHPHALRHSYATHLMNDGADLRVIQEMLGHASLVATEKYTHVSMDQLSRTMESFHPLAKKIS